MALQRTSGATLVRIVFVGGVAIAGVIGTCASRQRDDENRYEGLGACELLDGIDQELIAAGVPPFDGRTVADLVHDERRIAGTEQPRGRPVIVVARDDSLAIGSACTIARGRGFQPTLRLVVINAAFDSPAGLHSAATAEFRFDATYDEERADDLSRFESTVADGCFVTVAASSPDDDLAVSVSLEGDGGCAVVEPVVTAVAAELAR